MATTSIEIEIIFSRFVFLPCMVEQGYVSERHGLCFPANCTLRSGQYHIHDVDIDFVCSQSW